MRDISETLRQKFQSSLQTKAAGADPSAIVWIYRPTPTLTDGALIESSDAGVGSGLTAVDVAIRRTRARREPDRAYVAYVASGRAGVKSAALTPAIDDMAWATERFDEVADDVAVAFDGTMPQLLSGAEFVTEARPWIFWTNSGVLKGRILGLLGDVTLASANATKVSAIRAPWAEAENLDFGLVVFFLLSGALYYRQLIGGEWKDAEPVTFGPSGVTWVDIAAFRTWDYRIGVQALASNGKVYELITQFMGIGRHGGEHIEVDARSTAPYGGLYQTGTPNLVEAVNVDNGYGDYGKRANFQFDRHLRAAEVAAQPTAFRIVDSRGRIYVAQTAALASDGLTVRLTFLDFNSARGVCRAVYEPGTVHSMAGYQLTDTETSFTPRGLVLVPGLAPEPMGAYNTGNEQITVVFDKPLTGSLTGAAAHFQAAFDVPDWSPGGALHQETRTPVSVSASGPDTIVLTFAPGNRRDLGNAYGTITLSYDGAGPLEGANGPVELFDEPFYPTGLEPKWDSNDAEHIELSAAATGSLTAIEVKQGAEKEHIEFSAAAAGTLTEITYRNRQETEHIAFSAAASGTLTHIDDL